MLNKLQLRLGSPKGVPTILSVEDPLYKPKVPDLIKIDQPAHSTDVQSSKDLQTFKELQPSKELQSSKELQLPDPSESHRRLADYSLVQEFSLRLMEILEVLLAPEISEDSRIPHESALKDMISVDPKLPQGAKSYPNDYLSRILMDNYATLLKLSTLYFNLSLSSLITKFLVNIVYSLECWEVYHLLHSVTNIEYFLKLVDFDIIPTPYGDIVKPPSNYLNFNLRQGLQYSFPFPFYNFSYHTFHPKTKRSNVVIQSYIDIRLNKVESSSKTPLKQKPQKLKSIKPPNPQKQKQLKHPQNVPQVLPQNPPQIIPQNVPQILPHSGPQNLPQSLPQGLPQGFSQNLVPTIVQTAAPPSPPPTQARPPSVQNSNLEIEPISKIPDSLHEQSRALSVADEYQRHKKVFIFVNLSPQKILQEIEDLRNDPTMVLENTSTKGHRRKSSPDHEDEYGEDDDYSTDVAELMRQEEEKQIESSSEEFHFIPSFFEKKFINFENKQIAKLRSTHQCMFLDSATGNPCLKIFYGNNELRRHQEFVHAQEKKRYRCHFCSTQGNHNQWYPRHDSLSRHIRRKHGITGHQNKVAVALARRNAESESTNVKTEALMELQSLETGGSVDELGYNFNRGEHSPGNISPAVHGKPRADIVNDSFAFVPAKKRKRNPHSDMEDLKKPYYEELKEPLVESSEKRPKNSPKESTAVGPSSSGPSPTSLSAAGPSPAGPASTGPISTGPISTGPSPQMLHVPAISQAYPYSQFSSYPGWVPAGPAAGGNGLPGATVLYGDDRSRMAPTVTLVSSVPQVYGQSLYPQYVYPDGCQAPFAFGPGPGPIAHPTYGTALYGSTDGIYYGGSTAYNVPGGGQAYPFVGQVYQTPYALNSIQGQVPPQVGHVSLTLPASTDVRSTNDLVHPVQTHLIGHSPQMKSSAQPSIQPHGAYYARSRNS